MTAGVVIAGGGLAAQRCGETLRSKGYEGRIRIVSDEPVAPYDRPPLSKGLLLGEAGEDELSYRDASWYPDSGIELMLGERAEALDPERRELRLASGSGLEYAQLLIATGSAPRRLPFAEGYSNVHYLRTVSDAVELRSALRPGARLVVIGAGFIGQEVAASARRIGAEVTIVEALEAPLVRILGAELGRWFAELHTEEGVEVILGAGVARFVGDDAVREVVLADGRRIASDAVLVGIGVAPATEWLAGSGLPTDGVPVDALARTELPHVFAAGDAARPFDPTLDAHVRTEHWEAAARQGVAAARGMLGLDPLKHAHPSFWSDQYGTRIQYLGHADGADSVTIDGDPRERDFTATLRRRGHPVAVLLVGRPRALAEARRTLSGPRDPGGSVRELSATV